MLRLFVLAAAAVGLADAFATFGGKDPNVNGVCPCETIAACRVPQTPVNYNTCFKCYMDYYPLGNPECATQSLSATNKACVTAMGGVPGRPEDVQAGNDYNIVVNTHISRVDQQIKDDPSGGWEAFKPTDDYVDCRSVGRADVTPCGRNCAEFLQGGIQFARDEKTGFSKKWCGAITQKDLDSSPTGQCNDFYLLRPNWKGYDPDKPPVKYAMRCDSVLPGGSGLCTGPDDWIRTAVYCPRFNDINDVPADDPKSECPQTL